MDDEGVRLVVYTKGNAYRRQVVPGGSSTVLSANGIPTSTFTLDDDHEAMPALSEKGARCAFWFRGVEWFRGRVGKLDGVGPVGTTTMLVEGDARKLWDWEGWPAATDLSTQGTIATEYARYTGTSEAVARAALVAAFARLGVPWTVAASSGRGLTGRRIEFRFHPLADKVIPILDEANLLLQLAYHPTTHAVTVSFRSAVTLPQPLTELTGVIEEYQWGSVAPAATRVVAGGAGEGVAREFLQVIDTEREEDWGDIIETFRDARMADAGASLLVDAQESLAEGAPTARIGLDLQESERFMFGTTFLVGDRIPVELAGGALSFTERITQVQIDDDPDNGVTVTPRLGAVEDSADDEMGAQVARLARGVRDQGRR